MRWTKNQAALSVLSASLLLTACVPVGPLAPLPPKLQCRIPADLKKIEPLPEFPAGAVDAKAGVQLADKLHARAISEQILRYQAIAYAEERCEFRTDSKVSADGVSQPGR